jgi:ribosomal protein S18 acetylase RimI-like enzyme
MASANPLKPTPWDSAIYGVETFELLVVSEEALALAARTPGHHTAKVDPLASKRLLHAYGFYYCDTLIEPHCRAADLVRFPREGIRLSSDDTLEAMLEVCHGAFAHDRFHRDFNLEGRLADQRYDRWLEQLRREAKVFGLHFGGRLAAFIALSGNRMVLHAVAAEHRGKGLAKYLWSAACTHFFESLGLDELESSISPANLPVLNLYASLGFRFGRCTDVYHRLVAPASTPMGR